MDKVIELLPPWEVHIFSWGTAVRHRRTGKWHNVFIPSGRNKEPQELDVEFLNVEIDEDGIHFLIN